jgi:catechol 2,3-dioxygenase-like lactoylglutathione lyase family enzyme
MAVRRIVAYAGGDEVAASRDFYVEVLGMRVAMEDPVLDLQSPDDPAPEVIIGAREMQDPQPSFGVDVGEPAAVDAAHARFRAHPPTAQMATPMQRPDARARSIGRPEVADTRQRARPHSRLARRASLKSPRSYTPASDEARVV